MLPTAIKKVDKMTTKIDLDSSPYNMIQTKRKRDETEDYDRVLTNDQYAMFQTKAEKQRRTMFQTRDGSE